MQGELTGKHVVFRNGIIEQRPEQRGALCISHTPTHHAATEDVEDDVEIEVAPLRGSHKFRDVPGPDLIGPLGDEFGLPVGGTAELLAAFTDFAVLPKEGVGFSGDKSRGYTLSNVGVKCGATLVKELAGERQFIHPSRVPARLPTALRETLLKSYQEVMSNYLERRWVPSELNGGKFCEAVYSVVSGALRAVSRLVRAANGHARRAPFTRNELADPSRTGDRSLRLLIPRGLPVLYEVRNNRGVGHVGGDVDANHMDAEAVQAMISWVMAELVRIFHGVSTHEARQTVDALTERKTPAIWDVVEVSGFSVGISAKNQVSAAAPQYGLGGGSGLVEMGRGLERKRISERSYSPRCTKDLIEFDAQQGRARISPRRPNRRVVS